MADPTTRQHLQEAFPDMNWDANYKFGGDQQLNMPEATDVMQQLETSILCNRCCKTHRTQRSAEVDPQRVEELLGRESAEALQRLSEMACLLEENDSHKTPKVDLN